MVHDEWCEKCGTYLVFTHDEEGKVILKCGECGNVVNKGGYYHWELEKELKEVWDCKHCGSTEGVIATSIQRHRAIISGIGKKAYEGMKDEKIKKKGICLKCGKKTPRPWVRNFYTKDWDDDELPFPTPKNDKNKPQQD